MTNKLDMFKCSVCGNIVEVVISGGGELVCCNKPMELLIPKDHDLMEEKHVPILEVTDEEKIIRVGEVPHPMEESHYIEFIEVISKDKVWVKRKYLKPHQAPEMHFKCECKEGFSAVEYCNLHGFWGNEF